MVKYLFIIISIVVLGCKSLEKNVGEFSIPVCMQKKIDSFKIAERPIPLRVVEYVYKEEKVYYVVMPCCDNFNVVYDSYCRVIGHPDGGFTGRGDGKLPDFFRDVKNERLVWENKKNNR